MTKIVINKCFGGFGLSDKAHERYLQLKGIEYEVTETDGLFGSHVDFWLKGQVDTNDGFLWSRNIERNDPALLQIIEELGEEANGWCSDLGIVEIPDDVDWEIAEYDGNEHVAEKHRTWY